MNGTAIARSWAGNSGGKYPSNASQGERPVAEPLRKLLVYSTQGRYSDNVEFVAVQHLRADSRSFVSPLSLSIASPTDSEAPKALKKSLQTWDKNLGPLVETLMHAMSAENMTYKQICSFLVEPQNEWIWVTCQQW